MSLRARVHADMPFEIIAEYRNFERAVLEHLAAEEAELLPLYAVHSPMIAATIREEHAQLRVQLYRCAVAIELHTVRTDDIDELLQRLRTHALRERAAMYAWADAHLPTASRRRLFVQLGKSLRELAKSQPWRVPAKPMPSPLRERTGYTR